MNGWKRILVGAATLLLAGSSLGCLNYASMQSADVVPKEKVRSGTGATYTQFRSIGEADSEGTVMRVPSIFSWTRYGLMEDLEVHSAFWVPMGGSVGAKYQYLGGPSKSGPSVSFGLDLGYSASNGSSGTHPSSTGFVDAFLPVYTGYRFTDKFAAYFTPKYVARTALADEAVPRVSHATAGALGIEFGDEMKFNVEVSGVYDLTNGVPMLNAGVGVSKFL